MDIRQLSNYNLGLRACLSIHLLCGQGDCMQALTDLADFVASHDKAGDLPALANSLGQQMQLLKRVQWQAALLVERAFWSFHGSPQPASRPSGRLKSAKV